ncbi:MAG: hypothetical protein ACPGRX_04480 [Bdellovibrionales bacterium]
MSDNVKFELLEKLMKETRDAAVRSEKASDRAVEKVNALEYQIAEGFANLRSHDFTHHTDMAMMERRVAHLETEVERLSRAQGINADE